MKKLSILAVLLGMVYAGPLFAFGRLNGWAEQGNQSVSVGGFLSTTKVQRSYTNGTTGATITVYLEGTATLATIYSDELRTAKANPFAASSTGFWFFYADDGDYDVTISDCSPTCGLSSPFTIPGLRILSGLAVNNVTAFGAACDGTTDDGTAINAAITAAGAGGVVEFPADKTCKSTLLHTITTDGTIVQGAGPRSSVLESSNTTGALKVEADFVTIQNLGIKYTGVGAVGLSVTNGTTDPSTGVFEPKLLNLKIWSATAGSSHGLSIVNALRGVVDTVNLPSGGTAADALHIEASAFFEFTSIKISVNDGEGGPQWLNGITCQKQASNLTLQCDDNTFTNPVVEGVSGTGILLTSTFGAGLVPARNVFIGGTSEGNGRGIYVENGQTNRFYGVHMESSGTQDIEVATIGSHGNAFYSCDGNAIISNGTAGAQSIQATKFFDHNGSITIGSSNVFGTVIWGVTGAVTDSGTETFVLKSTFATSPNAVTALTVPFVNERRWSVRTASATAIQGSGGTPQTIVALPAGIGVVHVWANENGTTNMAYYQVGFVNGTGIDINSIAYAEAGANSAQLTFSLSSDNLQAIGLNATPPTQVMYVLEYWVHP